MYVVRLSKTHLKVQQPHFLIIFSKNINSKTKLMVRLTANEIYNRSVHKNNPQTSHKSLIQSSASVSLSTNRF